MKSFFLIMVFGCLINFPTHAEPPCPVEATIQKNNQYTDQAKELLQESKIFSVIPKLLEMAQIKDLIPVINEIEVKKDKGITEYLMLNEVYERLGKPEKQIQNLEAAHAAIPNDPRPLILLAIKNFDLGNRELASQLFHDFLRIASPDQFYLVVYAMALAEPAQTLAVLLGLIWLLAYLLHHLQSRRQEDLIDVKEVNVALPLFLFTIPTILAIRFWQTGKALLLAGIILVLFLEIFLLFRPLLAKIYRPVFSYLFKGVYFLLNGTLLAQKMESLPGATRIFIAIFTLIVGGAIIPTIQIPDLKIASAILCSLMFYSTVGSLFNSFFRSRKSLMVSLKWVAIAATLPFLISYIITNWSEIGQPFLFARLPDQHSVNQLVHYLVYWVVSLGLAIHLGRIMATSLTEPINEIIRKVSLIENGDFTARVNIDSKDEIGRLAFAVNHMSAGLAKREKIEKTFSKYLDKKIAERIIDGMESEVRIEGQFVPAVVLFVDIRGFTALSEKQTPQEIVAMLNQYLDRMTRVVKKYDGVIDKFIGDNVMAVWGVPSSSAQPEKSAVLAGLEMLEQVRLWNEELARSGHAQVGVGIGINSGEVVAGSLGGSEKMEYTVIGDVVNTAKRIEGAAHGQQLLVSESCYQVIKDDFNFEAMPPFSAKGKDLPLQCYRVLGLK